MLSEWDCDCHEDRCIVGTALDVKVTENRDACCDCCEDTQNCMAYSFNEELCDCILYSEVHDLIPKNNTNAYICDSE